MTVIPIYTKKKVIDIRKSEDTIDREYANRLNAIRTRGDLNQFLEDFEEFIPSGFQLYREATDEDVQHLASEVRRFIRNVLNGQPPPSEPTLAIMFCQPYLICTVRMFSNVMASEQKRRVTWGEAFLKLQNEGYLKRMFENQEKLCQYVISIQKDVEKLFDVNSQVSFTENMNEIEVPTNQGD